MNTISDYVAFSGTPKPSFEEYMLLCKVVTTFTNQPTVDNNNKNYILDIYQRVVQYRKPDVVVYERNPKLDIMVASFLFLEGLQNVIRCLCFVLKF